MNSSMQHAKTDKTRVEEQVKSARWKTENACGIEKKPGEKHPSNEHRKKVSIELQVMSKAHMDTTSKTFVGNKSHKIHFPCGTDKCSALSKKYDHQCYMRKRSYAL